MLKNTSINTSFHFIRSFLKPFWIYILGMVICSLIWAMDLSIRPYLIKVILDRLSNIAPQEVFEHLKGPILSYIGMSFLVILFSYRLADIIRLLFMPRVKQKVIEDLMGYMMNHSHNYFQHTFAGSLTNKINDVSQGIRELISIVIDGFFSHGLALLIVGVTLYQVQLKFSLLMIGWVLLFLWVSIRFGKVSHRLSDALSETRSKVTGKIVDTLSNIMAVRFFNGYFYEKRDIHALTELNVREERALDWFLLKLWTFQGLSLVFVQTLCLYFLIKGFKEGNVTVGDFALILSLNISIVDCMWDLSRDFPKFTEHLGRVTQGLRLTTAPIEIKDMPNAETLVPNQGEIEFRNVTFYYAYSDPLFKDLSVTIKGGEKVGLVGYSGSGKTSFANLIVRLFEIQEGAILIDGQDISKVTQASLRDGVSVIPQDTMLFNRTLLENIRYGRSEASDEEVIEAAKKAHAHEFILALKDGYQTMAGERGVRLSGGQRQRIAIARAALKNAPILILDEATSALDTLTEHLIQESLEEIMQEKTALVIAHRLSTLLHMDRILVFDKGRIIEDGTHQELIEYGRVYKSLWEAQVQGFLPEKRKTLLQ